MSWIKRQRFNNVDACFQVLHKYMGTDAGIIRYSMHHSILLKQNQQQRRTYYCIKQHHCRRGHSSQFSLAVSGVIDCRIFEAPKQVSSLLCICCWHCSFLFLCLFKITLCHKRGARGRIASVLFCSYVWYNII